MGLWKKVHDHLNLVRTQLNRPNMVSDLWSNHLLDCDSGNVNSTFTQSIANQILETQKVFSSESDRLCWKPSQGCTTKEAYRCLSIQANHTLPLQGARHISPQALSILKMTWKHKTPPFPIIEAFTWHWIRFSLVVSVQAPCLIKLISSVNAVARMRTISAFSLDVILQDQFGFLQILLLGLTVSFQSKMEFRTLNLSLWSILSHELVVCLTILCHLLLAFALLLCRDNDYMCFVKDDLGILWCSSPVGWTRYGS